jgi:hypothetical protein
MKRYDHQWDLSFEIGRCLACSRLCHSVDLDEDECPTLLRRALDEAEAALQALQAVVVARDIGTVNM